MKGARAAFGLPSINGFAAFWCEELLGLGVSSPQRLWAFFEPLPYSKRVANEVTRSRLSVARNACPGPCTQPPRLSSGSPGDVPKSRLATPIRP